MVYFHRLLRARSVVWKSSSLRRNWYEYWYTVRTRTLNLVHS